MGTPGARHFGPTWAAQYCGAETQAVLDELSSEIERLNKENAVLRQRVHLLSIACSDGAASRACR